MPPVVQLETKWALEYGMPSTHAMIGLSVPASVIIFTMNRYQYPFLLWVAIARYLMMFSSTIVAFIFVSTW